MFEDNSSQQPNTPAPPSPDKPAAPTNDQPVSPAPVTPSSSPAPAAKPAQEPEDIFDQADPVKAPTQAEPSFVPAPTPQPSSAEAEPAIKTPPSVFTKKPDIPPAQADLPEAPAGPPVIPPQAPPTPLNKKNLTLLIIIILIIAGFVATAIWWLGSRESAQPQLQPPAVLDLFNGDSQPSMPTEQDSIPAEPAADDQSPQVIDTDGDGLSDEEEILLGTSLNSPDTDNDGLYDQEEVKIYNTDPLRADTDNDGWPDGQEVELHQDPLTPDAGAPSGSIYLNDQFKIKFSLLDNLVLESSNGSILQFNDNINQVKLYIYFQGSAPQDLIPDITYEINEDASGYLALISHQSHVDQTPYSTDYVTYNYQSNNGNFYLIRYLATQRAPDHQQKFEQILLTFQFLK